VSRAAVFIGVNRTGGLPKLADAAAGAKRMADEWARRQPMDSVQVITDEKKAVTAAAIKRAVAKVVDPGNLEQLVIYFSGHGVNLLRHEFWLLSGAAGDPQECINVAGSEDLGRYCGVPHVIFISDACRTAAQGIGMQSLSGSEMFRPIDPNKPRSPVDQFYACKLGAPANEIADPDTTTKEYRAAYTAELLPALTGQVPEVVEPGTGSHAGFGLIRAWPLQDYLERAMAVRLADPRLKTRVIQVPDADIASRPTAWISRVRGVTVAPPTGHVALATSAPIAVASFPVDAIPVSAGAPRRIAAAIGTGEGAMSLRRDALDAARTIAEPFGPTHQESGCGFKVRGARVVEAFSARGRIDMHPVPADVVRVWDARQPGTEVLLVLEDGSSVVLPAIPGFLASLTLRGADLVDVAYEPSEFTPRWSEFKKKAPELRNLRGAIAAATAEGVFRLRGPQAKALARRMQFAKGVDPSLAVYAAYAYNDQHRFELLRDMRRYMRQDLGGVLFDVALLDHELNDTRPRQRQRVLGMFPLLSQGWAYLSGRKIRLPAPLMRRAPVLQESVWTKFDPRTTPQLKKMFTSGDFS
jgi:hypothetical protein